MIFQARKPPFIVDFPLPEELPAGKSADSVHFGYSMEKQPPDSHRYENEDMPDLGTPQ
jgi:hypothetical protein